MSKKAFEDETLNEKRIISGEIASLIERLVNCHRPNNNVSLRLVTGLQRRWARKHDRRIRTRVFIQEHAGGCGKQRATKLHDLSPLDRFKFSKVKVMFFFYLFLLARCQLEQVPEKTNKKKKKRTSFLNILQILFFRL